MIDNYADEWLAAIEARAGQCLGNDCAKLEISFLHYLYNTFGRHLRSPRHYLFRALAYTVRDRLMTQWKRT